MQSLAQRLAPRLIAPEEAVALEVPGSVEAGVLVPLYAGAGGDLHAVLTLRRHDLRRHPGEISFPGGRRDHPGEDLRRTALREAQEEIGLDPAAVSLAGALTPTPTFLSGYAIYPFVGIIAAGIRWTPSAAEVAGVLELRLRDLRAGHARRRLLRLGVPVRTDTYTVGEHLIWGATARIVADLLDRAAPLLE